jgi:hypothetical protein
MNLMTSEAALRLSRATTNDNIGSEVIWHATVACALGRVLIARSASGVCAVLIGDADDELEANLAACCPDAERVADETVVREDLTEVIGFLEKPSEGLHLSLDMRGTPF